MKGESFYSLIQIAIKNGTPWFAAVRILYLRKKRYWLTVKRFRNRWLFVMFNDEITLEANTRKKTVIVKYRLVSIVEQFVRFFLSVQLTEYRLSFICEKKYFFNRNAIDRQLYRLNMTGRIGTFSTMDRSRIETNRRWVVKIELIWKMCDNDNSNSWHCTRWSIAFRLRNSQSWNWFRSHCHCCPSERNNVSRNVQRFFTSYLLVFWFGLSANKFRWNVSGA